MYRCDVCGSVSEPGTPATRLTVETRVVEFPKRDDAHWQPPRSRGKGKWVADPGGIGEQLVREVIACPLCAAYARERVTDEDEARSA